MIVKDCVLRFLSQSFDAQIVFAGIKSITLMVKLGLFAGGCPLGDRRVSSRGKAGVLQGTGRCPLGDRRVSSEGQAGVHLRHDIGWVE